MEAHNKEHGEKNQNQKVERYLRNKYILVKDNLKSDTTPSQDEF